LSQVERVKLGRNESAVWEAQTRGIDDDEEKQPSGEAVYDQS